MARVRVVEGWAVFADGEQHPGGAEVEVDDETARVWVARGWVEPVKAKRRR